MTHCLFNKTELKGVVINDKFDCIDYGGDWVDQLYKFDDILQSMIVLFMIQSSEGWLVIMLQ